MKTKKVILLLVVLLAATSGVCAAGLTMEEAVRTALMQNADMNAARYEVRKAQGRLRASGLLPNPEIEFTGLSDFVSGNKGEGEVTLGLYQMFPLTSRLGISREISRVGVAEALREIRNQERILIASVQDLYVKVQATRMRQRIGEEARRVFKNYSKLAADRLEAGQGSLAESALARVEAQRWFVMANGAHVEVEKALMELRTALNLPANEELALSEGLEKCVDVLRARLQQSRPSQRPDVELQLLALDRAGAEARLARASAWEGVRIGIEYKHDKSMNELNGLDSGNFLGVGVSLPLPVWDRKTGDRIAADATAEQQAVKVRALELQVANAIASAKKQVGLYEAQWKSYHTEAEPMVVDVEREMEEGFKVGRVEAVDVISVRLQSDTMSYESVQILENLALSLVELEAVTGTHSAINTPYVSPEPIRKTKKKKL